MSDENTQAAVDEAIEDLDLDESTEASVTGGWPPDPCGPQQP